MVTISDFRHTLSFSNVNKTANTSGGNAESFDQFLVTRGAVKKLDGYRDLVDGYDKLINTYEMTCYWRQEIENNLTKDTRITYDSRIFRVETYEIIEEVRKFYRFKVSEAR